MMSSNVNDGRRIVVTGGREYADMDVVRHAFDSLLIGTSDTIVNGGCRGADELCRLIAVERGVNVETMKADWNRYGRSAGPIRNSQMIASKPDIVMAFPGGRGTSNCVNLARDAKIPIMFFQ